MTIDIEAKDGLPNAAKPSEWVTVPVAAMLAGRAPRTIYDWITKGDLATRQNNNNVTEVRSNAVVRVEATKRRGRPKGSPTLRW